MQLSSQILIVLFAFILSFVISGTLAQFPRFLPDIPNERSAHASIVSRGGGIAIIIPFLISLAFLLGFSPLQADLNLIALIIGSSIIWIVGFVDDAISQQALPRLIIQIILVTLVVTGGLPEIFSAGDLIVLQGWPARLAQIFWILVCINFFNFMDGLDGLAAFQAIFICAAAAIMQLMDYENMLAGSYSGPLHPALFFKLFSTLLFSLSAAIFGFLIWNLQPARLFMGDNGSYLLGFVIGYVSLLFPHASPASGELLRFNWNARPAAITGWLAFCILFFPFMMDAGLTLLKRLLAGKNVFQAHRNHFFQLLHRSGNSPMQILLMLAGMNAMLLFPLWLNIVRIDSSFILSTMALLLTLGSFLYFMLSHRMEKELQSTNVLPFKKRRLL